MKIFFASVAFILGSSFVQAHSDSQPQEMINFDREANLCDYGECRASGYSHHACVMKSRDCRDKN